MFCRLYFLFCAVLCEQTLIKVIRNYIPYLMMTQSKLIIFLLMASAFLF